MMATITPVAASTNAAVTFQAATASDTLALGNAPRCVLHVNNASGSAVTVTFAGQNPCNWGSTHNMTVNCPAGATTPIPFDVGTALYGSAVTAQGNVTITYSSTTSVTVAAVTN